MDLLAGWHNDEFGAKIHIDRVKDVFLILRTAFPHRANDRGEAGKASLILFNAFNAFIIVSKIFFSLANIF